MSSFIKATIILLCKLHYDDPLRRQAGSGLVETHFDFMVSCNTMPPVLQVVPSIVCNMMQLNKKKGIRYKV